MGCEYHVIKMSSLVWLFVSLLLLLVGRPCWASTCHDVECQVSSFETCEEFRDKLWKKQPGVWRYSSTADTHDKLKEFQTSTTRERLGASPLRVKMSTSVSYTGRVHKEVAVAEYVADDSPASELGNETYYLFGNHQGPEWEGFLGQYPRLESSELFSCLYLEEGLSSLSFGCARKGTGVPFHFHGDGFLQVLVGSKTWFLAPPDVSDEAIGFDPNITTREWFLNAYPSRAEMLSKCTLLPGDIIYFPPMWKHATYNTDEWNSWMSTFL